MAYIMSRYSPVRMIVTYFMKIRFNVYLCIKFPSHNFVNTPQFRNVS
jgi:hypothetical protein